ncbi:MAG: class I SAM-dependent methyltransferase [Gammaproteobacteria bacterium]|nr:class I SAM-dependent methyltransferase [Gammaproteobacteria bacterium]
MKDHFSRQAAQYRASRPDYPAALLDFLAAAAAGRGRALDCATGSGQAAIGLASRFAEVVATDLSVAQLARAPACPNVRYVAATAERLPLAGASVDLVTVAQALHWLDLPAFYAEVRRVARPGALVAAWSYGRMRVDAAVDAVVERLYSDVVGPYWPPGREHVENGYRDLPFPFSPVPAPAFAMVAEWRLERLLGYLASWSAVQRYEAQSGRDPLDAVRDALHAAWGDPGTARRVEWPLALRVGAISPPSP